jgi:hypothetical protein
MGVQMKLKTCEVGLFRLPGLVIEHDKDLGDSEMKRRLDLAEEWSKETRCGKRMSDYLWSFRNEKQRDMFILRWSDQ